MASKNRGIVLAGSCEARTTADHGHHILTLPLDHGLVKSALLYWDRIDIPDLAIGSMALPEDYGVLADEGILSRQFMDFGLNGSTFFSYDASGGAILNAGTINIAGQSLDLAKALNNAPVEAFYELLKSTQTDWAYLKNSVTVGTPQGTASGRSILIDLHDALPAPDANTPFDKILRFKEKRQSELLSLRGAIDALYERILQSGDADLAQATAFNELESAVAALNKVAAESLTAKHMRSFKIEMNIMDMAEAAAFATMATFPYLHQHALFAGALAAGIKCIKYDPMGTVLKADLPARLAPYQYALDVKTQLPLA